MNVDPRYEAIGGKCKEGVISHFQGWKRNYFAATSHPPPLDAHIYLITESGFIPFRSSSLGKDLSFGQTQQRTEVPGRLSHLDLHFYYIFAKRNPILGAMHGFYELKDNHPRKSSILGQTNIATSYCAGFSYDVKKCTCPVFGNNIRIVQVEAKSFPNIHEHDSSTSITLIITAWADAYYSGALDKMQDSWDSLKV